MLHRPNWGALLAGLVLLAVAGAFLADTVSDAHVPLLALIPLLLVGLGVSGMLARRYERGEPTQPAEEASDEP